MNKKYSYYVCFKSIYIFVSSIFVFNIFVIKIITIIIIIIVIIILMAFKNRDTFTVYPKDRTLYSFICSPLDH